MVAPACRADSRLASLISATMTSPVAHRDERCDGRVTQSACADDEHRRVGVHLAELADGAEDRDARTGEGAGKRGIEMAGIDQVSGMRHQHMGGKAAVLGEAEAALVAAKVFVTGLAPGQLPHPIHG